MTEYHKYQYRACVKALRIPEMKLEMFLCAYYDTKEDALKYLDTVQFEAEADIQINKYIEEPVHENDGPVDLALSHEKRLATLSSFHCTTAPYLGIELNGTAKKIALEIFTAYNEYRVKKNFNEVVWNENLSKIATASALECAKKQNLSHRTIIEPLGLSMDISDILIYTSWQDDGYDIVKRWSESTGHNAMMLCESTKIAGVGCCEYNGCWYYVLVYDFIGCNQYVPNATQKFAGRKKEIAIDIDSIPLVPADNN